MVAPEFTSSDESREIEISRALLKSIELIALTADIYQLALGRLALKLVGER